MCVERRFIRGVFTKSDPDALVCSSEILMSDVAQDLVISLCGIAADDCFRGHKCLASTGFSSAPLQADFGENKQEAHQSYNNAKLTIGCGAVADLVLDQTCAHGDE